MQAEEFLKQTGCQYFVGVPDSQLKAVCACLLERYGTDGVHHVIAANEGNAMAMAAGYYLATGQVSLVYMQNSGIGNAVNPLASLLSPEVYGIPCILLIGWRGEPGTKDEPQHRFQGKATLPLLETMQVPYQVLRPETRVEEIGQALDRFRPVLASGRQVAFVVAKGALTYDGPVSWKNDYPMTREFVLQKITDAYGGDTFVSTTGKASRELFELREARGEGHGHDFLTVGSMGHASSIALAIAQQQPDQRVWCLDGDGAALMHMGAMAVIGSQHPENLVHVVLNNEAHESVGGMPTVMGGVDLPSVARACGYPAAYRATTPEELADVLSRIREKQQLTLLEVRTAIGSRSDLGRPTTTPQENKQQFMETLGSVGRRKNI